MDKPCFASQDLTAGQLNALVKLVGGEKVVRKILNRELVIQLVRGVRVAPEPTPPPVLVPAPFWFKVQVHRPSTFVLPAWIKKVTSSAETGPTEYRLEDLVSSRFHHDLEYGILVDGEAVFEALHIENAPTDFIRGADLYAIRAMGPHVFEGFCKHHGGQAIVALGAIAEDEESNPFFLSLYEKEGELVLEWTPFKGTHFSRTDLVLRLPAKAK